MRCELDHPVEKHNYRHLNIPAGYLRIAITTDCGMQCSYCHNEGQTGNKSTFLSIDQLRDIVTNALPYGLVKVRLTGGEPLLHPDCHQMLRMLKKELKIPFVGFNTTGILLDRLLPIVADRLLDSIVVGIDYVDGEVSKDSSVGLSSKTILENILKLKKLDQDVSIACVYDGDCARLEKLADWCLRHNVILKILEVSDKTINTKISEEFTSMIKHILDRFDMQLGEIKTYSEYYGLIDNKPRIYFFHSHCRLRECDICARIHLRVTSDGYIKSCILHDVKYPLLSDNFDDNMLKVIHNLGRTPEDYTCTSP